MPEIDFVMSYPCFFLQGSDPSRIKTGLFEGETVIPMFTDRDLALSYFEQIERPVTGSSELTMSRIDSEEQLMGFLFEFKDGWAEQGIHDLVIDVTKGKMCFAVAVEEFIRELKKH